MNNTQAEITIKYPDLSIPGAFVELTTVIDFDPSVNSDIELEFVNATTPPAGSVFRPKERPKY